MSDERLIVITHSPNIAAKLRAHYLVKDVRLIPQLIVDVNNFYSENIGVKLDGVPDIIYRKDYKEIYNMLSDAVGSGNVLVAFEPRHDAICWAQQIGSMLGFTSQDKRYVALGSLRPSELDKALVRPAPLTALYPWEWFYLRMFEGVFSSNINSTMTDSGLSKELPPQNIYSLYLLYKLGQLSAKIKTSEYSLIVRDSLTGQLLGEQIGAPNQRSGGKCLPNAAVYHNRADAEEVLNTCKDQTPEEIDSVSHADTLLNGHFPTTSLIFSRLLRDTNFSIGNIFNELYKLYAAGRITYPFGSSNITPNTLRDLLMPVLDSANIQRSDSGTILHSSFLSSITSLPLTGNAISDAGDRTVLNYLEILACDAFRANIQAQIFYHYFKIGDAYFGVKRYDFPNTTERTQSALGFLYPTTLKPSRFRVYVHSHAANDRVPFNMLLGFSMQSPCWIKWFVAFHYLMEKGVISMDGENVCITKRAISALPEITERYGEIFDNPKFLAFDNVFNDVKQYSKLVYYLLSLLPNIQPDEIPLPR